MSTGIHLNMEEADKSEYEVDPELLTIPAESITSSKSLLSKKEERFPKMSAVIRTLSLEQKNLFESGKAQLGTLLGVYFPTILHVLGVLLFIRLPWCVGIMGIVQAFIMVSVCCLTTLTACTSLNAVVTNGRTGRGGPYYLITRSLGPEVGSALGIFLCLANTIAVAMYILGGLEILLISIAPQLIFGEGNYDEIIPKTTFIGEMTNNYRVYGIALTVVVFAIVLAGVRFTQIFALLSLIGLLISMLSLYVGAIEKSVRPGGPYICLLGETLLVKASFAPRNVDSWNKAQFCPYCLNVTLQGSNFCTNVSCPNEFTRNNLSCVLGVPGFSNGKLFVKNYDSKYLEEGEATGGNKVEDRLKEFEVHETIATSFFICLAIFFPSVTGIKTGANMSGDLKKPHKSIPLGTMLAWLTTTLVYLSYTILFGAVVERSLLEDKEGLSLGGSLPIAHLAWPHYYVVIIGAFVSTFGAAIQALCSAPKLLQSIADDDVIPCLRVFSRTFRNEPLLAQVVLFFVSILFLLIAKLDSVAPLVQQMFLSVYFGLNLSCAVSSWVGFPSWRPRYRFYSMHFSFFGALLALMLMFATSYYAAPVCIVVGVIIYIYVALRGSQKEYGDAMVGLQMSLVKAALLGTKFKGKKRHIRWQPRLLVLSSGFGQLRQLIETANALSNKGKHPFSVLSTFMRDDVSNKFCQLRIDVHQQILKKFMQQRGLKGYCKPFICDADCNVGQAMSALLVGCQVGHLRPNSLLLNAQDTNLQVWTEACVQQTNTLIITKGDFPHWTKKGDSQVGNIDIWWILADGDLLLALGRIITRSKMWKTCKLRLFMVVVQDFDNKRLAESVKHCLKNFGVKIQFETVKLPKELLVTYLADHKKRHLRHWNKLKQKHLTPHHAKRLVQLLTDQHYREIDEPTVENYENIMGTAEEINKKIVEKSADSCLVIMNIPPAPKTTTEESMQQYWSYLDVMSKNLKRVLLIRGHGAEIVLKS